MKIQQSLLSCYDCYKLVMDHNQNPLRHIPDPVSRMWIMIALAWMWSIAFGIYFSSVLYMGISMLGHLAILFMVFFTVGVFYDAEKNNDSWLRKLRKS